MGIHGCMGVDGCVREVGVSGGVGDKRSVRVEGGRMRVCFSVNRRLFSGSVIVRDASFLIVMGIIVACVVSIVISVVISVILAGRYGILLDRLNPIGLKHAIGGFGGAG